MIDWDAEYMLDSVLWQCGDCGNYYEYSIRSCPNTALDQLLVAYEGHKIREREEQRKKWISLPLAEEDYLWYSAPKPTERDVEEAKERIKRHRKHKGSAND